MRILISESQLLGAIAKWGIRQSPYPYPDNLEVVLRKVHDTVSEFFEHADLGFIEFDTEDSVREFTHDALKDIPEWLEWNDRKNGNDAPFQFTSRYDTKGNPDDDFIDLDAMIQNIAREMTLDSQNVPCQ